MRRIARLLSAVSLIALAACADNSTSPEGTRAVRSVGALSGEACVAKPASEIEANLTLLMQYVLPNDNSTLGKFQQVKDALAVGDFALAQERLDNLINFINLKYGQLTAAEQQVVISEPAGGGKTVSQFKEMVIADLICFISFDLNPGDPARVFVTDDGMAGVWFPPDYVPVGTNVEITNITGDFGPGESPLVTPFDKYPTYVEIKLVPTPAALNGTPVVVVCFPNTVPSGVADRLLLGHQKVPNEASGFDMYEQVEVPQELADQLVCQGGVNVVQSGLEKWLRKAADLFLPQRLHAAFFGPLGVGGSPEEFSPFGAVDPQLTARGGAGGSPEEFLKGTIGPTAQLVVPNPNNPPLPGTFTTGQVGTQSTLGLPAVTVQTQGGDADGINPVQGVTVTFTLGATNSFTPPGNAHFCEVGGVIPTSVVVLTDATGAAALPCLNFGTAAGYLNLKATVDGSSLGYLDSELLSLVNIVSLGSSSGNEVNFLIEATAGAAAKFTLELASSSDVQAGVAFLQQPKLQLRDANDNEVLQANVSVTAAIANGDGTLAGDLTVETDANGIATFTDLRIDGVIGVRTLTFTSAHPAVAGGTVNVAAGLAARLAIVTEPSGAKAGVAFTTQPSVRLEDDFGNDVASSGVPVTAAIGLGDGALFGDNEVNTVGGVATFTDLRIDGVIGPRSLAFSATGLDGVTSASFSVAPGAAAKLVMVNQPSSTAPAGVAFAQQPSVKLQDFWNNDVTSPQVGVTASVTIPGAGALAGTLLRNTVSGMASFTDLRIDGVAGSRSLDFNSAALASATSTSILIGAGVATVIQTYMPTSAPVANPSYSFGTGLVEGAPVSDAPQVRVTDMWTNPVDGAAVTWSPLSAANGAAAVVGSGGVTASGGLARITSWTLGAGANQLNAEIAGSATPASFTGSTPTGQVLFACPVGGSKTDIGFMSFPKPITSGTIREITLYMSITGQSSTEATYNATVFVRKNSSTGTQFGGGAGGVTLPGNNGSPRATTFLLSDPVTVTELAGTGANATNTIWVNLAFSNLPGNRKIQVWYNNAITKSNQGPCFESKAHSPSNINSFKRGLGISVTN